MGHKTGFGRPPKHTQFRKGQSGKPNGRPKGSKNFGALFDKVCEEMVTVNGALGPRKMSKLMAGFTQLVNKAASGDLKAIGMLIQWKKEVQDLTPILPQPIFVCEFVDPRDVQNVALTCIHPLEWRKRTKMMAANAQGLAVERDKRPKPYRHVEDWQDKFVLPGLS